MPSPTPSIHNTEPITMDDVIIIGGSFAGLAGALQLGRARRKVTVLDTGLPGPIAAGAARAGVLARQAARQKTGQVSVNFPGRHVTCRRQFSQRDWPLRARKMVEELTGDLDGYRYTVTVDHLPTAPAGVKQDQHDYEGKNEPGRQHSRAFVSGHSPTGPTMTAAVTSALFA